VSGCSVAMGSLGLAAGSVRKELGYQPQPGPVTDIPYIAVHRRGED
jgi:hypothetical protein